MQDGIKLHRTMPKYRKKIITQESRAIYTTSEQYAL
jgi:hypothetical protein